MAELERQFEAKASELRTAYLAEAAEIQASKAYRRVPVPAVPGGLMKEKANDCEIEAGT
jgi:hypothetical protein